MITRFFIGAQHLTSSELSLIETRVDEFTMHFNNAANAERHIPPNGFIEVFGALENCCIYSAVRMALAKNSYARIPHGLSFKATENARTVQESLTRKFGEKGFGYFPTQSYRLFYPL